MSTQITPFTRTPSRSNPSTFSEDMDIRLSEENSRILQMNAQSEQMNTAADYVNAKEAAASTSALEALNQKNLAAQQIGYAAAEVAKAVVQVGLATTKANESSANATLALQMRNETEALIELMPSDVNLAYSKAGTDALLAKSDLENFLDFKF